MDLGLKDAKCLVTGASQGLGFSIAKLLVQEGAHLSINSRDEKKLIPAADILKSFSDSAIHIIPGDLAKEGIAEGTIVKSASLMGGLDILVTNTGGPKTGRLMDLMDQDWQDAFALVFLSHVRLIRSAFPYLEKSSCPSVLCITSISAKQPIPDLILSNSMRAGVLGLVKSLALELGKTNIRFNAILPSWTKTERALDLLDNRSKKNGTTLDIELLKQSEASALGRLAEPEEFAKAAVFLLSPAASYITGVMLTVDGGTYKGLI
jgi:3-oxoacyl-[acyl-carrier protein] reductase